MSCDCYEEFWKLLLNNIIEVNLSVRLYKTEILLFYNEGKA